MNFKKTRKNIIFIFRLNVKGQTEEILLDKESILDVRYTSETPDDSNARAPDLSVILDIEEYGNQAGTGTFMLKIKQKKEKVKEVAIEGGYASQEA